MTTPIPEAKSLGREDSTFGRSWPLQDSYAWCTAFATRHYENFPVGGRWIPRSKRKHVHAIYAFARIADDFADEARYKGSRLDHLYQWREMLKACYEGQAEHPVFVALSDTTRNLEIPQLLLADLLTAFEQDVVKSRYRNFQEVVDYCSNSANPVGRLVLLIFGYHEENLHQLSDSICTGLQLANFWQDVAIDLKKDRIYLPQDEMARFEVDESMLQAGRMTPQIEALMEFQIKRTRELFLLGHPLPLKVNLLLGFELRLVWLGGMRILEKLDKCKYDF